MVVSGLPRSGTSMMMKMLAEGGLEILSDAVRGADEDNPNGYFELEPVKQLTAGTTQWLANADGRVVKIISSLLEYLPREYHYKIIFMERDLQEVLASQQKMLKTVGNSHRFPIPRCSTSLRSIWPPSSIGWPTSQIWMYCMSATTACSSIQKPTVRKLPNLSGGRWMWIKWLPHPIRPYIATG